MYKVLFGIFLGILGGAVELMLQVGSHDAATNFCTYFSFYWAACAQSLPKRFDEFAWMLPTALGFAGTILIAWASIGAVLNRISRRNSLVPLNEAASHIYGEIRGTDLGRFTEGLTDTPNDILDSIGMQILHNVPVQVRRAPSPKWEIFPKSQLNKMGVCQGATGVRYWGDDRPFYSDPKVSRYDMRRVAKQLKKNANFVSEWSKAPPSEQSKKTDKLEPDIDAGAAFNQILTESEWRQEQLSLTRDTNNLVRNWLEVRLDNEIHKALVNSKLQSWGEEILPNGAVAPERPIPADAWIKVEIIFGRIAIPRSQANWRVNLPYTGKMAWVAVKFSKKQLFELFPLTSTSRPINIIFDSSNPGRKFWSVESMRDESGQQVPGTFWEYRALIKNTSSKTLRNVKVTLEAVGLMPTRPEPSQFDINKKHLIDLTPDEEVLVLIRRWFNPPIVVGMVCGGAYGPIKMTASADDVLPTVKMFQFDPECTPMIFE
jgi:hypothetical protein